eukprot:61127_1
MTTLNPLTTLNPTQYPTQSPTKPIFSGNNESWYIWIDCVPTSLLMPLFVVLLGIICQALIAYFITFPTEPSEPKKIEMQQQGHVSVSTNPNVTTEIESHCGCCTSFKKSTCGTGTAYCMIVWQILSMTVILILDLVSFFKWKESDYIDEVYDSTTWNNYQCFSARIVISSNYSLVVLNFIAMSLNPDWKDGFRIAWNLANGILFFCYCIWLIMYGLVGAIAYFWITIFILGPAIGIFVCCRGCKNKNPFCHQCCMQIFGPIFLMFFVGILALTCINLFEGMNYWTSFENVLLERRWDDFYHNLDAEAIFRWFTAFLG